MCFAALQFFCSVDFSRLWTFRKNLTGSRVSHSAVSGTVIYRVTHLTVGKLQRQNEQQRCTWTLWSQRALWRPSSDCTDVRTPFTWSARLGRWTTRNAARRHTSPRRKAEGLLWKSYRSAAGLLLCVERRVEEHVCAGRRRSSWKVFFLMDEQE